MRTISSRPHVSRPHARRTFTGHIAFLSPLVARLVVRPGAHRRTTDDQGDVLSDTYEATARLWSNLGDRLLLSGDSIADIAIGEIYAIAPDGALHVRLVCGELPTTADKVHILPMRRLPARAKAAA